MPMYVTGPQVLWFAYIISSWTTSSHLVSRFCDTVSGKGYGVQFPITLPQNYYVAQFTCIDSKNGKTSNTGWIFLNQKGVLFVRFRKKNSKFWVAWAYLILCAFPHHITRVCGRIRMIRLCGCVWSVSMCTQMNSPTTSQVPRPSEPSSSPCCQLCCHSTVKLGDMFAYKSARRMCQNCNRHKSSRDSIVPLGYLEEWSLSCYTL